MKFSAASLDFHPVPYTFYRIIRWDLPPALVVRWGFFEWSL